MDLIIAGVGGQGVLLTARVLGQAALDAGIPVLTSETIGMAQRGGMVQSHVRIGVAGIGPLIPDGAADALLGFEPAEAARSLSKVRPGARAVVNTAAIQPLSIALGTARYDFEGIVGQIKLILPEAVLFDATALAERAGDRRATNSVMLGALAGLGVLPLAEEAVRAALLTLVRPAYRGMNETAFGLGLAAVA